MPTNLTAVAALVSQISATNFQQATFSEPFKCPTCGRTNYYVVEHYSVVRSNEVIFVLDGKEQKLLLPAETPLTLSAPPAYLKRTNIIEHPAIYRIPGAPRSTRQPIDLPPLPRRASTEVPPTAEQLNVPPRP